MSRGALSVPGEALSGRPPHFRHHRLHDVLEWLPFTRILTRDLIHVPGSTIHLLVDYTLGATESGTVLTMAFARPEASDEARASFDAIAPTMMKAVEEALGAFKERIETESLSSTSARG